VRAVVDMVNSLFYWVRGLGLLGLGLYFYARGELPLGSAWAIVALRGNADFLFAEVGRFVTGVQQSLAAAARVFELLDRQIEPACYAPGAIAACTSSSSPKLAFQRVSFRYPEATEDTDTEGDTRKERSTTALQDITLDVSSGQTVALVGPSGSGKSTLVKLLLGFYQEQEGEVLIDGQPARGISLQQLRERMAYVPQEAYLFDGSVEENIRMGQPTASFEDVQAVAIAANAHAFILDQPEGYQTQVGERGAKLSGGQRQRIAIARALLKDAPILLLDEATSALDSESEQLVQDALDTLMRGRTTLAIAHRLSTIEHADVIYVMDQGHIVERGSHRELVAQDGLYTRLHSLQFAKDSAASGSMTP
jgi:ATP-binding cassette subfamily B protein